MHREVEKGDGYRIWVKEERGGKGMLPIQEGGKRKDVFNCALNRLVIIPPCLISCSTPPLPPPPICLLPPHNDPLTDHHNSVRYRYTE